MTTGGRAGTVRARPVPAPGPAGSPLTAPGAVLVAVLATWTAVPSLVAPPKLTWALTAGLLALVANAVWWHARELRWTAPVTGLAVLLACGLVSSVHFATPVDLAVNGATALLLLGCGLLAAVAGPADVRWLARGIVLLALVQLAVALAVVLAGLPVAWSGAGTSYRDNPLLPAAGTRSSGTMAHPIPFGTLMAVAVAVCVPRLTGWRLPVRLAAAVACCAGVALSGSRSAALVLGLALLVAVLLPGVLRIGPSWRAAAVLGLAGAVLVVDAGELAVVRGLEGTGSLTHRLAAWDAAGRLAGRPPAEFLLGSGAGSLDDLFAARLLQLDGFFAVDNQLVATFAVAGLLGVLALLVTVATGLLGGHRASRPAALLLVLTFGSFDVLEWTAPAVLTVALLCLGTARRPARSPLPGQPPLLPPHPLPLTRWT